MMKLATKAAPVIDHHAIAACICPPPRSSPRQAPASSMPWRRSMMWTTIAVMTPPVMAATSVKGRRGVLRAGMIPESGGGRRLSVFTVGGVFLAIRNPRARGLAHRRAGGGAVWVDAPSDWAGQLAEGGKAGAGGGGGGG